MKYLAQVIAGLVVLVVGGWVYHRFGSTTLVPISFWLGLLAMVSVRVEARLPDQLLIIARVGLLVSILTFLGLTVYQNCEAYDAIMGSSPTVHQLTWLQWIATPVATGFNLLVNRYNWGIFLYPEFSDLCYVLTFFGNVLVHMLVVLLVMLGLAVRRKDRELLVVEGPDADFSCSEDQLLEVDCDSEIAT